MDCSPEGGTGPGLSLILLQFYAPPERIFLLTVLNLENFVVEFFRQFPYFSFVDDVVSPFKMDQPRRENALVRFRSWRSFQPRALHASDPALTDPQHSKLAQACAELARLAQPDCAIPGEIGLTPGLSVSGIIHAEGSGRGGRS